MGQLRAYLDAALQSLKSCSLAPSTPPPPCKSKTSTPASSAVRPPVRRRGPPARVERSSSTRLGDLELVRTLAPALFGEVLLCSDRRADRRRERSLVAVKRVELASARAQRTLERGVRVAEDLERERAVHYALVAAAAAERQERKEGEGEAAARDPLGSSNLLLLREEIACRGSLFLVFDFCARGDLFDRVRAHRSGVGRLPERAARAYLEDVVRALAAMKRRGFAHRDISLENVMLVPKDDGDDDNCNTSNKIEDPVSDADSDTDLDDCCYLGDFGLAARADRLAAAGRVGKTWYMAPEVFAADRAVDPLCADAWSLGVLLAVMLTGAPLVRVPAASDAHFRTISADGGGGARLLLRKWFPSDNELSAAARDLLAGLLVVDPARRLTLEQVAAHEFFQNGEAQTRTRARVNSTGMSASDPEPEPVNSCGARRPSIGGAVARSLGRALSKTRFSWASTSSSVGSDDLDASLSC